MRAANQNTVFYAPENAPSDISQLPAFIDRELFKIKMAIDLMAAGHLDETYVAPTKPRNGDISYADGTQFKPNGVGGKGIYYYNGTTWVQLG